MGRRLVEGDNDDDDDDDYHDNHAQHPESLQPDLSISQVIEAASRFRSANASVASGIDCDDDDDAAEIRPRRRSAFDITAIGDVTDNPTYEN